MDGSSDETDNIYGISNTAEENAAQKTEKTDAEDI